MPNDQERRDDTAVLQAELAAAERRLSDIYASTSWRISAPVRFLGRQIRRLRRPFGPRPAVSSRRVVPLGHQGATTSQAMYSVERQAEADGQSFVHEFTAYVAERCGCRDVLDMSCRVQTDPRRCVVLCPDAFGPLVAPEGRLRHLREVLEDAPFGVVTAPAGAIGLTNLVQLLEAAGIEVMFSGFTPSVGQHGPRGTALAVVQKPRPKLIPPATFRVVAFIFVYNDEDVIRCTLEHLIGQGVEVHLIDNWCTDNTIAVAGEYLGRGLREISRFPKDGPTGTHDLHARLLHVEALAERSDADWILVNDADEIREAPWPRLDLRTALYQVDRAGFNAIDYTVLDFRPTGHQFSADALLQTQFRYFEFGTRPGHFRQMKGWKRSSGPIELAWSGGHEVRFPGRRVYPFKFLLRHYSIRTQEQGERKIFDGLKRLNRYDSEVRGWHVHYDELSKRRSFVWDPETLLRFDEETFYRDYVVERLSGVGIIR